MTRPSNQWSVTVTGPDTVLIEFLDPARSTVVVRATFDGDALREFLAALNEAGKAIR